MSVEGAEGRVCMSVEGAEGRGIIHIMISVLSGRVFYTMFPPCDISCKKAGLRCGAMPALVGSPRGRLGKGGGIPG